MIKYVIFIDIDLPSNQRLFKKLLPNHTGMIPKVISCETRRGEDGSLRAYSIKERRDGQTRIQFITDFIEKEMKNK